MRGTPLKETKLGKWFKEKSPKVFNLIAEIVPGADALKAINALIDNTETSDEEKIKAKLLMEEIETADRANARNREIEITKSLGQRDWMQVFVGSAAMIIGIVMVIWAKTGVQDKEIFFHILGFAEGTLVGQVVNYYFGSAKK